ncbi:YcnI family protein [Actinoplanes sp. NPDC051411]|uniref:YcnI family copper-binding membrane protein n=1 Tax=Actinoplanes sp. NPDC051411 TaxID=3155522 RepID=UPI00343D8170
MSLLKRASVVVTVAGLLVAVAAPAQAHVTVNPNTATPGGYTKVTFRVPNEMDNAKTTKLEVALPADQPIASVSVKPVPGWTATPTTSKLATPIKSHDHDITEAVSRIVWTADAGSAIKPGEFQEFDVSLGPLPASGQLIFKALQTYSDGTVVRWIDEPSSDGTEPEHPAAVLKLTAAAAAAAPVATQAPAAAPASIGTRAPGVIGLIAAVVALLLAAGAFLRAGRRPAAVSPAASDAPSEPSIPAARG